VLLSDIRGQNQVLGALSRALEGDRLPNAYLFEGPSGVGKQTVALALAKARLCPQKPGRGCDACSVCARVTAGNHPDARVFPPRSEGNRNLPVDTLRKEILPVAQFAPFEGSAAFLIFPEADVSFPEQHPEAANALLKTLEEPRPNVVFVLLTDRPDRLLITIRSRCQRVRFARLGPLILEHVLEKEGVPQEQWEAALALADGRADRALAMAKDGFAGQLLEQALRIDKCVERGEPGRLVELSEELTKRDDLPLLLETLATFYRDVAASALELEPHHLYFRGHKGEIEACAKRLGAGRAAARAHKLAEVPELLSRNANPQITLDHLLLELRGAR
jgi:DNA polymerase-3 subunit delta'